jgi:hypothetical protein
MGIWEEYCTVCGGPTWIDRNAYPTNTSQTKWLADLIGVERTEQPTTVLHHLVSYSGYGDFATQEGKTFQSKTNHATGNAGNLDPMGIICHRECMKLLQCTPVTKNILDNLFNNVAYAGLVKGCKKRYAGIEKYHSQSFDIETMAKDNNTWMIQDPSRTQSRNRKRILAVWYDIVRKPPSTWKA